MNKKKSFDSYIIQHVILLTLEILPKLLNIFNDSLINYVHLQL